MDLTKYQAQLDAACERIPFPISEEELLERYEKVTVPMINDALREEGLIAQTLPNGIMPLKDEMKAAGFAFTVTGCQSLALKNEMEERTRMLCSLQKGDIVVWDTSGDTISAQWGEMMTKLAKRQGCVGAVIDGGVRDTRQVLEQNFPVFCKYRSSNGMLGRFRTTAWQCPIMIGEVKIFPGDVIFGDIDGVIVVPRKLAYKMLLRAEGILNDENGIDTMIKSGMDAEKIVENGGYF